MSTFPPIAQYGFLSNCEQSCLVAPDGAVEWLCLPRPDSPSVFGALLDRGAGTFRFGPSSTHVPQHRRYVPGTMVLETTWQTPTGWMIVQDFLSIGPAQGGARRADYHRAPTDFGAVGALVRIATCISGRVEVMVNCAPLFNYGTAGGTWSYQGDGYDVMTVAPHEGNIRLELAGSIQLGVLGARGDFVASKVMCWVAAVRGADLAEERGDDKRAKQWRAGADEIKAEVLDKGVSGRGVFRQHYKTEDLDASLLLPIMGFLPPDDERIRATVLAIADELTKDGLVLRYRVDGTDTGFEGEEGTFTICSFWLVTALAMIGETGRAHALCEKLLSFAGPLLLYAEEIDTTTGEHLGNFPQAFTHLALIEAVSMLIETEPRGRLASSEPRAHLPHAGA